MICEEEKALKKGGEWNKNKARALLERSNTWIIQKRMINDQGKQGTSKKKSRDWEHINLSDMNTAFSLIIRNPAGSDVGIFDVLGLVSSILACA